MFEANNAVVGTKNLVSMYRSKHANGNKDTSTLQRNKYKTPDVFFKFVKIKRE